MKPTLLYIKTQELTSFKLIKCLTNYYKFKKFSTEIENCSHPNLQNIYKEVYKRFIIPLYIPILSLIPCLLILLSKENSKYQKFRIVTFLTGFTVIILSESTIKFISSFFIKNIIFIILPLIIFIFIYLGLINKLKFSEKFK